MSEIVGPSEATPIDRVAARELALFALAALGMAATAMLMVDYLRDPVFCADAGSGCDRVRHSAFARVAGVPLPILGAFWFSAITSLTALGRSRRLRAALAALGAVGAVAGLAFIAIQAVVLHTWCRFCVVVDASAIAAGLVAFSLRKSVVAPVPRTRRYALGTAAVVVALLAPLGWGLTRPTVEHVRTNTPTEVPQAILREQRPGMATVVEFVDFECPFCRRQQEALAPVLATYGSRVRLVRRNVPLSFHEHARDAARTACCADEQGRGDRMAEALFRAEDLTVEGCERLAREAGLDMEAYRACMASQRPEVSLERDMNAARGAGVSGLPTLWIGRERFEGLQTAEVVRASIDRALRQSRTEAPSRSGS